MTVPSVSGILSELEDIVSDQLQVRGGRGGLCLTRLRRCCLAGAQQRSLAAAAGRSPVLPRLPAHPPPLPPPPRPTRLASPAPCSLPGGDLQVAGPALQHAVRHRQAHPVPVPHQAWPGGAWRGERATAGGFFLQLVSASVPPVACTIVSIHPCMFVHPLSAPLAEGEGHVPAERLGGGRGGRRRAARGAAGRGPAGASGPREAGLLPYFSDPAAALPRYCRVNAGAFPRPRRLAAALLPARLVPRPTRAKPLRCVHPPIFSPLTPFLSSPPAMPD